MVAAVFFWVSLLLPQSPITMMLTSLSVTGIGFHVRTTGRLVGRVAGLVVDWDFVAVELPPEFLPESAPQPTNRRVRRSSESRCMHYPRREGMIGEAGVVGKTIRWMISAGVGMMIDWLKLATRPSVVRRALKFAIVVGLILTTINHGYAIVHGQVTSGRVLQMGLTVLVPYVVSTLSSVGAMKDME